MLIKNAHSCRISFGTSLNSSDLYSILLIVTTAIPSAIDESGLLELGIPDKNHFFWSNPYTYW